MAIDLATIADRIAVEQHLYLYAHLLDSHQFARVPEEVFTEDADVDFGGQRVVGREQIRAFVNGLPGAMRGTSHNISNVEILSQVGGECRLHFNWVTFSFRYKTVDTYFGTSFYTLDTTGHRPLIKRKKVVLKNDYIHHVIDIYHI